MAGKAINIAKKRLFWFVTFPEAVMSGGLIFRHLYRYQIISINNSS
jgi:hypothetical protein